MIAYAEIIESTRFQEILVDERRIREWRANKSNIEGLLGAVKGKQRSRLSGGGRKPLSVKLEEVMLEWVESRRARGLQVSCKLTVKKAEITYCDMTENNLVGGEDFNCFQRMAQQIYEAKWVLIETKDLRCSARSA